MAFGDYNFDFENDSSNGNEKKLEECFDKLSAKLDKLIGDIHMDIKCGVYKDVLSDADRMGNICKLFRKAYDLMRDQTKSIDEKMRLLNEIEHETGTISYINIEDIEKDKEQAKDEALTDLVDYTQEIGIDLDPEQLKNDLLDNENLNENIGNVSDLIKDIGKMLGAVGDSLPEDARERLKEMTEKSKVDEINKPKKTQTYGKDVDIDTNDKDKKDNDDFGF